MSRLLIIGFRLGVGRAEEDLLALLRNAVGVARGKGYCTDMPTRLARTDAGVIVVLAELRSIRSLDALDEDPEMQDIAMRIAALSDTVPMNTLLEFNATRVTFESID